MRIIGGKYRGIRFSPGKKFKARPTTDVARESLFNILNNRVCFEDLKVIDLFAGTGSISYEFCSRGCTSIVAVEKDYNHLSFIKECVSKLGEDKHITPIKADVDKFIEKTSLKFDMIFADPPYALGNLSTLPDRILNSSMLADGGTLIVEHGKDNSFETHERFSEFRKYGSVHFSFFE